MKRNIQYKIQEGDHEKAIGTFLKERDYSTGVIRELKKTQLGIRKNGDWAGVNEVLGLGDILDVCLIEEEVSNNIIPKECSFDIVYEDEDLLVVNKPYNMPIHPSINNYDNTLANGVMHYCQGLGDTYTFRCINRLDRDTTGVTIIGKHMLSASILAKRMNERAFGRTYIAFVEGITNEMGTINLPIGRAEGTIIKRQVDEIGGKEAITHYRMIEVFHVDGKPVSVVALRLETGRTHQIRVHMSAIGHPLLGDFLYNSDNHMLTRQALHGAECTFCHPITGEYKQMIAALPEDMATLMERSLKKENRTCELAHKLAEIAW